jgi:3-hydroxyisobutyrate dehydrogenase-like beta-hydroxyacid dehydrogenase
MRIGFIGLGNMGYPMARTLLRAGHALTVYNRTTSRAEALQAEGARVAYSPVAAARDADVLITMVADDEALEQVMFGTEEQSADEHDGALAALRQRAIHLSMSTIGVAMSRRLAQAHADAGQGYVAAPVFGRPEVAAQGELGIVVAGPADQVECCSPVFQVLGKEIVTLGNGAWHANVIKLAGNFLTAATIGVLGEAFALIRKADIDVDAFLRVITHVVASSPTYEKYGALIAAERFEPMGFTLALGLKDMKQLLHAAQEVGTRMPIGLAVYNQFFEGAARGHADLDWAGLARVSLENAELIEEK